MAAGVGDKVFLHIDVNGVAVGSEKGSTAEQYAQVMVAHDLKGPWGELAFDEWVRANLFEGDSKAQKAQIRNAIEYLETHYAGDPTVDKARDLVERVTKALTRSIFFESFDRLVDALDASSVVLIRTFGSEGKLLIDHVQESHSDMEFQEGVFEKDGTFRYGSTIVEEVEKIDELLHNGSHWFVQDSFPRWNKGEPKRSGLFGKLFTFRDGRVDLFFDDNAKIRKTAEETNIVACFNLDRGEYVGSSHSDGRVIPVSPTKAILEPEYLVGLYKDAVDRLSEKTSC